MSDCVSTEVCSKKREGEEDLADLFMAVWKVKYRRVKMRRGPNFPTMTQSKKMIHFAAGDWQLERFWGFWMGTKDAGKKQKSSSYCKISNYRDLSLITFCLKSSL